MVGAVAPAGERAGVRRANIIMVFCYDLSRRVHTAQVRAESVPSSSWRPSVGLC